MKDNKTKIKQGITVHVIKTNSFKTDLIAVFLTTKLSRENITKNAIIPMVLRKGTRTIESQEELSKKLEEMYGASFDCGIDKTGDNQVLKFYLETIDGKYLPQEEDLVKKGIDTLLEVVFDPRTENNAFKEDYIASQKEKLKILLEGKKDNKMSYANLRCQEEMYKDTPYGLYKYGYIEDLEGINEQNLYEHYKKLISECKIDIFISGDVDEQKIVENITKNPNIQKLNEREPAYNKKDVEFKRHEEREIIEKTDVTQGNLAIGLAVEGAEKQEKYTATVYNSILGGSATSKLFQIVREKHSLAYTASSNYLRHKNSIFIKCGIEIDNYQKTLDLIKEQIEDMKKGNFTEEDIKSAKTGIISVVRAIPDEQDITITYFLGQELSESKMPYDEYESKVEAVTKEDIQNFAKKVHIDTIFFLRN